MDKTILEEKIRQWIPENRWIRRKLTDFQRWRYDRAFLSAGDVRRAFGDPEKQRALLRRWERQHARAAGEMNRVIASIREVNPEFTEKTDSEAFLERMKYAYCAYGFLPYEYYNFGLFSTDEKEYSRFISDKEKCDISYRLNDLKSMAYFNDKWLTYKAFQPFFHRECTVVEKKRDYRQFQAFVTAHPVFFAKQVYGFGGHGTERMDLSSYPERIPEVFDEIRRKGKHIIEEPVRQSAKMAEFNESSVNTVRCIMILTKHGPGIAACFFRTGKAGACVDNAASGGVFAAVDAETGIVSTAAVDEWSRRYEKHPDSGIAFRGYRLPDWDRLLRLCTEASVRAGKLGCLNIGWDLAHTEEHSWVIVEGNAGAQLGEQNATQEGLRARIEPLLADV